MAFDITPYQPALESLCQEFGVLRLELFGSATTRRFDPVSSDLDFLIELDYNQPRLWDRYLGLKAALEQLFGRSVDLVEEAAITNPLMLELIEDSRRVLYAT